MVRVLARRRKDWINVLKKNRGLETASFHVRDANGWSMPLPGPHIAVEALVPLIPAQAYRPVTIGEHTYWCCTLGVRIPGLGKVRIVVSCEHESLTGRFVVLVTNRDLPKMMTDGQFREDLYFRVNSLEITLKRLVDRVEDLMLLAKHFAEQHQATRGRLELSEYDIFY